MRSVCRGRLRIWIQFRVFEFQIVWNSAPPPPLFSGCVFEASWFCMWLSFVFVFGGFVAG